MRSAKRLAVSLILALFVACGAPGGGGPGDTGPSDARGERADAGVPDVVDDLARDVQHFDGVPPSDVPSRMDSASGEDAFDDSDDGGGGVDVQPDVGARCTPGVVTCATADRTRTCLDDGGYSESDCPAGQICVEGAGCRLCEPGATRCAADGLTIETCSADGSTWVAGMRCDASAGMVCEGYRCVNACARAASQRSYLGCEYWPTTMANSQLSNVFTFAVTVANPQIYPVSVTISGGALSAPRTFSVAPGTTHTEELPWVSALSQLGSGFAPPPATSALVRNGAYRMVSTAPIAAYQFNPLRFTSGGTNSYTNDASLLLPTHVLTGNYTAITHNTWYNFGGEIVIVGTSSTPTNVTVNLTAAVKTSATVSMAGPGMVSYTLNRGDVLELIGAGTSSRSTCASNDLSGSTITADQPVAVFVGHDCTNMPCANTACDHLEEQLFPNETWGRSYVVSALRERSSSEVSVVRIMSQSDGNALTFTGIARPAACPATLDARRYCEFETASDFAVSGSGPLLVAQFMVGQDRVPGVGDPAMVLEVPTQQYRTSYVFNVPSSYTQNFLTVVYPTGMVPSLDGRAITAGASVVGSYSVSRFAVMPGSHTMTGPAPFGIKVTGTASYTSYMYPGGLDLNQITTP